ncbi:MAG: hypothetical protein ACJ741_00875 [Pyrinomonadaceae bacterium]
MKTARASALRRCASACLIACLLASSAAAYTLVMRGGQRVEIPDRFSLDGGTLTYEAAPGLSVTLQLSHVDVAATERANREPPGSFLRHAAAREETTATDRQQPARAESAAARTVTNRELEPARQARLKGEREYERRRQELGLPTLEESRRRAEEDGHELREMARRGAERDAEAERYWHERALTLRDEGLALDAEIDYLRSIIPTQQDVFFQQFSLGTVAVGGFGAFGGGGSFGGGTFGGRGAFGGGGFFPGRAVPQPHALTVAPGFQGVNIGALQTNGIGSLATAQLDSNPVLGNNARAGAGLIRRGGGGVFPRRGFRGGNFPSGAVSFIAPFDYASADTASLVTRLQLLEGEREGWDARWRALEDEARRAGALPGWLRP